MSFQRKKNPNDPPVILAKRRGEILSEYRHHQLDPVKIGGEPISMELALQLGLIVDLAAPSEQPAQREAV